MDTNTALQVAQSAPKEVYTSSGAFDFACRVADSLAASDMVPKEYRGKPANCLIAFEMANRLKMPPFMVMQQMNIIAGRPSWSSPFIIARINNSGQFSRLKFRYSGEGDTRSCVAYAKDSVDQELCESTTIDVKMAKAEGWWDKSGSKWPNLTDQMLSYRAAAFFARLHCPDVLMGMQTTEELFDIGMPDPGEEATTSHEDINSQIKARQSASTPDSSDTQDASSEAREATDIHFEEVGKDKQEASQEPATESEEYVLGKLVPVEKLENAKKAYNYYKQLMADYDPTKEVLTPDAFIHRCKLRMAENCTDERLEIENESYSLGDMPPSDNDSLT